MSAVAAVHLNRDPMTGGCLDCGATRENIDDNLFPTCEKVTGPNRIAIMHLRRELRAHDANLDYMRRSMECGERQIVGLSHRIREKEAERRELAASIQKLKADS